MVELRRWKGIDIADCGVGTVDGEAVSEVASSPYTPPDCQNRGGSARGRGDSVVRDQLRPGNIEERVLELEFAIRLSKRRRINESYRGEDA